MTYNPSIPQATDNLSDSQQDLLDNFTALNNVYGTDHFAYDESGGNATKHKRIVLPKGVTDPTPASGNGAMWAEFNSADVNEWVFPYWRQDGNTKNYPLSPVRAAGMCTISGAGVLTAQQLFNCTIVRNATGVFTVTFSDANQFKLATNFYYGVIATSRNSSLRSIVYDSPTTTGFVLRSFSQSGAAGDGDGFTFLVIQF